MMRGPVLFVAIVAVLSSASGGEAWAASPVSALEAAAHSIEVWRFVAVSFGVLSILAGAFAMERLGRSGADVDGLKAHRIGAIALTSAITGALFAALAAIPGGLWRDAELLAKQDWFCNNFELPLVAAGIAIVAIADRINRANTRVRAGAPIGVPAPADALVAAGVPAGAPAPAGAPLPAGAVAVSRGDISSVIIGCAIGVSILVAIGSSAFSASLWQRDMRAYVGEDVQVSLERVQYTVDAIGALDDRIAALEDEVDLRKRRARDYNARAAAYIARHERLWLQADGLAAAGTTASETVSDLRRDAGEATLNGLEERARAVEMSAQADRLIDEIDLLEFTKRCQVHEFAEVIANQMQRGAVPAPAPLRARGEGATCDSNASVPGEALARASTILETAQPLRRSWMSSQLARRTPILLSIELVLLMGALGALLRATATALSPVRPNAREGFARERGALLPLGLSIVFGMSTALVFFVLMKAALTATSTEGLEAGDSSNDLNPFTVALLGLAGGYAAREVLSWLGSVVRDRRRGDGDVVNQDDDESGTNDAKTNEAEKGKTENKENGTTHQTENGTKDEKANQNTESDGQEKRT